jgi:prepilin-type N-terminal cleavage/methylation domain-containing protein
MNKKGFTFIELLVYMGIIGVIVVIAGRAFSDSAKVRVRTENMIKANAVAEEVGLLLRDDLAQMGAKSAIDATTSKFQRVSVAVSEDDNSSFVFEPETPNANFDKITMLRAVDNEDGTFARVEKVIWYVDDNVLYRSCNTKENGTAPSDGTCPLESTDPYVVEVAENVTKFKLIPATPDILGGDRKLFPMDVSETEPENRFRMVSRNDATKNIVPVDVSPSPNQSAETRVRLSGFVTNYQENGAAVGEPAYHQVYVADYGNTTWNWQNCTRISINKGSTYEISFTMPVNEDASRMFRPGMDHFAVGVRNVSNFSEIPDVPDVLVYPPQAREGKGVRKMRFSSRVIPNATQVCVVFTFATFSPLVSTGRLTIADLKVRQIADDNYRFVSGYRPNLVDKPFVRAFKLELQVSRSGETGEANLVIPVPNNGLKE